MRRLLKASSIRPLYSSVDICRTHAPSHLPSCCAKQGPSPFSSPKSLPQSLCSSAMRRKVDLACDIERYTEKTEGSASKVSCASSESREKPCSSYLRTARTRRLTLRSARLYSGDSFLMS